MEDEDDFMLIDELIAVTNYVEQLEQDKSVHSADIQFSIPDEVQPKLLHNSAQMTEKPVLNCTGEDSSRSLFQSEGFVCNAFGSRHVIDQCTPENLFDLSLSEDTIASEEMLSVLFQKARVNIQMLDVAARENAKFYGNQSFCKLRQDVTGFLFALWQLQRRDLLEPANVDAGLRLLDMLMGSIESMPIIKIVHTLCRIEGNESTSPAYHLLHGQLEWRILRLSIQHEMYKLQLYQCDSLDKEFQKIIQDLVLLSVAKYNRLKRVDILYSTPFLCTCVKELWLLVQLLLEAVNEDGALKGFWAYINETLYRVRDKIDIYDQLRQNSSGVRFSIQNKLMLDNWTEFSIWLMCDIAKLQGFDERGNFQGFTNGRIKDNFECMDALLRDFLNSDPTEDVLRVTLYTVLPVLTKWWPPRTDVLLIFWEYFHKKLNSSFFLQGAAPSTLAVINLSVIAYLNQIERKMNTSEVNPNETSFSLFIFTFGRILRRLALADENQIKKIFGRITSKFSAPKLLALNETGIHNLASLFLTLALTTNLAETGQRLQTILLQMPLAKLTTARQISLTRAHVALVVLFSRRRINVAPYLAKLLEQLSSIHHEEGNTTAMRFLADGFVEIFTVNHEARCGEHLLFDAWLPRHLAQCASSDHERMLQCINSMLTKSAAVMFTLVADEARQQGALLAAVYATMVPYVLQAFVKPDASRLVAELAANLCLGCSFVGSTYSFEEVFAQFTEACVSNVQTLAAFLVIILTSDKQPNVNQTLIIQTWIKCHLCSSSANLDMKSLTNIVVSLDEFRAMYTGDASEIINTRDPLCTFFSEIGQSYQNTNSFQKRNHISTKVHNYLHSFDKYIAAPLENPDNFMKIYSMIAIIILHCASIVYVKHVLPNHLLTGRPQKPQYVQAIHKVWHLLVMGIEKLDFKHDQHLVTVLTNMIEKWVPHFKTQRQFIGRPFINCVKECSDNMGAFVMSKISNAFFVLQRRQPHAQVTLVLTIYQDMFNGVKHDQRKLLVLLESSCFALMEHAMMVDEMASSKNSIFEIFESIFKCECYRQSDELRKVALFSLRSITSKHLAYFSSLYFSFMLRFVKINAVAARDSIEFLRETISNVEVMRGAGRDGKLRNELDKLEGAILATTL